MQFADKKQNKIKNTLIKNLKASFLVLSFLFFSVFAFPVFAAPSDNAMMIYDNRTIQSTPKYQFWDGSSWGAEASANPVSGEIRHQKIKFSPTRNEAILVTLGSTGSIDAQVWNGSSWGTVTTLGTVADANGDRDIQSLYRGFDIEYESTSGDAIIVYGDGTADPNYRVWNGTVWSGETNIDIPTTGMTNWISLGANPNDDQLAFIVLDSNSDTYGMRWTGSAWNNMGTATAWETTASIATREAIDVTFERTTGDIMFAWGFATAATAHFRYRAYTQSNSTLGAVTNITNANNGGIVSWLKLSADPTAGSDKIMIGLLDAGADLNTFEWSGTAWSAVHTEHSAGTEDIVDKNFDITYETYAANAGVAWLVYGNGTTVSSKRYAASAWAAATTRGDDTAYVDIAAQPNSGALFALAYEDDTSATDDIREMRITGGGSTWSAQTITWSGPVARNLGLRRVDVECQRYESSGGSLSVDIVDNLGNAIASPSIEFAAKNYTWSTQQSDATFGISTQKIRVTNATSTATWTLSIAATGGAGALWNSGGATYDFNGSSAAGRLQVNPSVSTISPQGGCSATGLSKGSATYFEQGVQDVINVVVASSAADTGCYWDVTGINMLQDIPASQATGAYSIDMTLTAT